MINNKRNKPRRSTPASQYRAIQKFKEEAKTASKINTSERGRSDSSGRHQNIPTVLRHVVGIVPVNGVVTEELPEILQAAIDNSSKGQHNATRSVSVQLFNRKDGVNALLNSGLSELEMFERVSEAKDLIDPTHMIADISHFSVFGVGRKARGRRFVSAVLDEDSRVALQFQSNIVRQAVGMAPWQYLPPFHFSIYGTLDQRDAEEKFEQCRSVSARFCIELASPQVRTVLQRNGPEYPR
jgi:hypothetical protein